LELIERVRHHLGGRSADFCMLLASAHLEDEIEKIADRVFERLEPRALIGTTGEAVISGDCEYEGQAAVTLLAAHLPQAQCISFHLSQDDLERLDSPAALHEHLGVPPGVNPYFILLGDPFSINPLDLLARLEQAYPGRPATGGMASAGERPGQNAMIFEGQTLRQGACGVALWGGVRVDCLVSQGCRPIGRHMVITHGERNVIYALGGRAPRSVVRELLEECPPRDRELARERGLLIGFAINECKGGFGRGDFLIRNPMRFDSRSGALEVNDYVRTGQTVQFHVRDGDSADEDLNSLLLTCPSQPVAGALLFSCNGRGTRLFAHRHHDARAVRQRIGSAPLAGLFCAGEIGPIGRRNFLHGHTASIGFICVADP
jgi:small ligand-binding sensory domain FIST